VLARLPSEFATHTSQHDDYVRFAGQDVCVIGAGQSALEAAALLHESGARPILLVRGQEIGFSSRMPARRTMWQRIRHPESGLGPDLKSWAIEKFPRALHFAPDSWRLRFLESHLGPLGAWWLRERIEGKVPVYTGCDVIGATPRDGRLALRVRQREAERTVECNHVVAGTGYEVDLDRLQFLDPELRWRIDRIERGPALNTRFESSVKGLYFVGLASSLSFGPLFRFVAGAAHTPPAVCRDLARRRAVPAVLPNGLDNAGR